MVAPTKRVDLRRSAELGEIDHQRSFEPAGLRQRADGFEQDVLGHRLFTLTQRKRQPIALVILNLQRQALLQQRHERIRAFGADAMAAVTLAKGWIQ